MKVDLVKEMEESYLSYSLAVIVGRALPDLYDGLKPVHRRILKAMHDLGLSSSGAFKKSARVCGEVMGKWHPHGDAYGSMVTLAAPHSNNHTLIDGHGNWGSPTDNAAASRYTECRLSSYSEDVLLQNFSMCEEKPNYDGSLQEPIRLEAQLPNVLILGSEGIGVGYATNIAQHNLRGVVRVAQSILQGLEVDDSDLLPDFPSGCDIVREDALEQYLLTGQGSIRMRAKVEKTRVKRSGKKSDWLQLVFTNLPYQVNTEQISEDIRKGNIEGILDLRDESDLSGERLVVYCSSKEDPDSIIDQLYQSTRLEKTFGANNTVIQNMVPILLSPKEIIRRWLDWKDVRLLVQFRREKESLESRLHILDGLLLALNHIEKVVTYIRSSANKSEAKKKLMEHWTPEQTESILNLKLYQLSSLDSSSLEEERTSLRVRLTEVECLIEDKPLRDKYLIGQLEYLQKRHGNTRKCQVISASPKAVTPRKVERKPRYLKIDSKRGTVEQLTGPRSSSLILQDNDKLIILSEGGVVKRLPSKYRGPAFNKAERVPYFQKQSSIVGETLLAVWVRNDSVYSNVINGEELCKTTSTGKRWLPPDSKLLYLGKDSYQLPGKKVTIQSTKPRPLGGVGNKLCSSQGVIV